MSKPLCIDLFCGLGGWAHGFLVEGYDVVGFDIEQHVYGDDKYPAQLVLQDVLTLHGSQFRKAAVIVASPPCQAYSYRAMPWKRAKALPPPDNSLFKSCFRIAGEAGVPLVVENVKGAQPWLGRAQANFGSYFLWGNIYQNGKRIFAGKQFDPARPRFGERDYLPTPGRGAKVPGFNFHQHEKTGEPGGSFQSMAVKNGGNGSWFNISHGERIPGNQGGAPQRGDGLREGIATKVPGVNWNGYGTPGYKPQGFNVTAAQRYREEQGAKQEGSGAAWFDNGLCKKSSRSDSRKAASAQIAKIPFPLAQHIASVFKP